ncbi:carboxypeptidase D [Lophium mytilinum]|uniref:Carboxypeptidase n=1 Tax=Lophium mytilinum TaxID=390894 RepID=A0A6A6QA70_9PEZI|nr:carboxypeptidase D [Lophium mytilinum]
MRFSALLAVAGIAGSVAARSPLHVGKMMQDRSPARPRFGFPKNPTEGRKVEKRATILPQNANTTKYAVDGTALPDVDFDIGESYAGLMPISSAANASELYFWYFPSSNPLAEDEITIWLNGGPGCSSLEGFLQENGPVLWQYGTFKPVQNPWTWVNLTNMVWVEQPVGTGFSQGTPTATNEAEAAAQFLGFFKNFVDTFGLQNKKIYITGESYAGMYVPYIADAMFNKKDKTHFDIQSIMIYDPSTSYDVVQQQIPAVPFVDAWAPLFNLNKTFTADIHKRAKKCGYTDFLNQALVFPPKHHPLPSPPSASAPGCDLWDDILNAVLLTNPCFDIYAIATTCPLLWDVLGFPGSIPYQPEGATIYFNRTEVQKAINAPVQEWEECSNGVLDTDTSPPSGLSVLPKVIERTKRTVIVHGELDYILIANGTLMMIQNMTWHGKQGFQSKPKDEFFVPYHDEASLATMAASGIMGTTHTERGLTWVETRLSGHMVPQYQPSAAYRQLEFLLGRIDSLTEKGSFTTQPGGHYGGKERREIEAGA